MAVQPETAIIYERFFALVMPDGRYFRARAALDHLAPNPRPHFSLTGEEWKTIRHYESDQRNGREIGLIGSGAMGDELVKVMPELAAFNKLHLADDEGIPMYAEANGWYWYSDYDGRGTQVYGDSVFGDWTPHERAASYLRLHPDELMTGMDRETFGRFVETLRRRWRADAEAGIAFLTGSQEGVK